MRTISQISIKASIHIKLIKLMDLIVYIERVNLLHVKLTLYFANLSICKKKSRDLESLFIISIHNLKKILIYTEKL